MRKVKNAGGRRHRYLKETLGAGRPGDPCVMVIFGASGDLTKRKLIPALYNLAKDNLLSKEFALVGFARNELTSEQFRDEIGKEIGEFATTTVDPDLWHWFSRRIYYHSGDFGDPNAYKRLERAAGEDRQRARHARQLFLLSGHRAELFWRRSSRSWARPGW